MAGPSSDARGFVMTLSRAARGVVTETPWTFLVLVLGWVGTAAAGGPGPAPDGIATGLSALQHGRWWTPLSAALWWGGWVGYVVTTVFLLVFGRLAERKLGPLRALGAFVATQVLATLLVLGVVALLHSRGQDWAGALPGRRAVGAIPGIVGAGMAASSALSAMWRRRLRLGVLATGAMLVTYSGVVADAIVLVAALLGLAIGMALVRHPDRTPGPASGAEARLLVALLVAVTAIGPVVATLTHGPVGPLSVLKYVVLSPPPDPSDILTACRVVDPLECRKLQALARLSGLGPAISSAVPVLLLLVVAEGLRRGRRSAWRTGMALNLVLFAAGMALYAVVTTTPDAEIVIYEGLPQARQVLALLLPSLLPLAVAAVMLLTRSRFRVEAPAGGARRMAALMVPLAVGLGLLYVFGGAAVADQFDRPPDVVTLLADLPSRFLPPGYLGEEEPAFLPVGPLATLLWEWTGPVLWLVLVGVMITGYRRSRVEPGNADAARTLLVEQGGANLSWMTTWTGNAHWVRDDVAVAYQVHNGVAVTVGDPVGGGDVRCAIAGFAAFCRERGFTPAFYSVTEVTRDACVHLGWSDVQVAEETVLDLTDLEFKGKGWQDVRTALNKAAKAGVVAEWISYAHAPLAIVDQIRTISEEWVADKGLPEMGFTLGGLSELADDDVRCLVAVDADRTVHGVTSWLPVHRDGSVVGYTLDFMRRRSSGAFRPVTEFLIASAAQLLRGEGYSVLSLSGAPLARLDRGSAPSGLQRVLDVAGGALEPVYGFRSLLAFKAKFQPAYLPLYLCYPDPSALPAIGLAIGRAYLPDLTARQSALLFRLLRRD